MKYMLQKIDERLRYQKSFEWQRTDKYKGYRNSFEYHVHHHPIDEQSTGKWNPLINYDSYNTIADSYCKTSVDLAKKFDLIPKDERYDIQYIEKHGSVNMVDNSNGLIVCLKYKSERNNFDIATCYFPSKLDKVLSIKDKVFLKDSKIDDDTFYYTQCLPNNNNSIKDFKEAMEEFFGVNSIECKILFNNENQNIDIATKAKIIRDISEDIRSYLDLMESFIKNEDDKEYYFVYHDGIEYVAKLSLLYKTYSNDFGKLYQKFLNIDINNTYKDAIDICKYYIKEGEKNGI